MRSSDGLLLLADSAQRWVAGWLGWLRNYRSANKAYPTSFETSFADLYFRPARPRAGIARGLEAASYNLLGVLFEKHHI